MVNAVGGMQAAVDGLKSRQEHLEAITRKIGIFFLLV